MKENVSQVNRKLYLSEFSLYDGDHFITFNIVDVNTEKQEITVAVSNEGRISVCSYDLYCNANKDNLELVVTESVHDFLSDPANVKVAVTDTHNYYEKKTCEESLKSVEVRISKARKEVEELADAFVKAKSQLLQNTIEKKMNEYEVLLDDLLTQQAKLELERGYKITNQDMQDFISNILKGDPKDKEYQRSIIDNLVTRVIVSDDDTIVTMNIRGDSSIEGGKKVSLSQINDAVNYAKIAKNSKKTPKINAKGVQTQLPTPRHQDTRKRSV